MRHRAVLNKGPTVIPASVALARLSVYANGKSMQDHRNPNIPIFIFLRQQRQQRAERTPGLQKQKKGCMARL